MHRPYCSEVLDHLGLVAGMFDELGIGDVLDRAMQHTPETRIVTVGSAVKAMVLNGLGFVNQQLYLAGRQYLLELRQILFAVFACLPPSSDGHATAGVVPRAMCTCRAAHHNWRRSAHRFRRCSAQHS